MNMNKADVSAGGYTVLVFFAVFMLMGALTACKMHDFDAQAQVRAGGSEKVSLRVSSASQEGRTVSPVMGDVSRYELWGTYLDDGSDGLLGYWEDLSEASVEVNAGRWDFTLTAFNASGSVCLEGSLTNVLVPEVESLSFELKDIRAGTGSFTIRVITPAGMQIRGANYSFNNVWTFEGAGPYGTDQLYFDLKRTNVPAGEYPVQVRIQDMDWYETCHFVEVVKVRQNLESNKTIELSANDFGTGPHAPQDFGAFPIPSARDIHLSWTYPTGQLNIAEQWEVWRRPVDGPADDWTFLVTLDGAATGYIDTDATLAGGADYEYWLVGGNNYGSTDKANTKTVTTTNCRVIFDPNGGSGGGTFYGQKTTVLDSLPVNPELPGTVFIGWFTHPMNGNEQFDRRAALEGDVSYYARWQKTITYVANRGFGTSYTQEVVNGIAENLEPCAFSKPEYTFVGWATTSDGAVAYADSAAAPMTGGHLTLYARWSSFLANPATDFQSYPYGAGVEINNYVGSSPVVRIPEFIGNKPVLKVSYGTFRNNVTEVHIGELTTLGSGLFSGCANLESVTLNSLITTIPANLFYNCISLQTISIPESVTTIEERAFSGCMLLTSVEIPQLVNWIGTDAFYNCTNLSSVTVRAYAPPMVRPGAFMSNAPGRKIYVPASSLPSYLSTGYWPDYTDDLEAIP